MTTIYNDLIAPALLLRNPGVTREEFVQLLDNTHSSSYEYEPEYAWDYWDNELQDKIYHRGLNGLASILGLEESIEFIKFQQPRMEGNHRISAPEMFPAREGRSHRFEVTTYDKNTQKEEKFNSEEELYTKWPQFNPEFRMDWTQEGGSFNIGCFGIDTFLWLNKKGKYYLDTQTFDRIPASFRSSLSMGYSDLILTAEAIKHKAWKMLSRNGMDYFYQFLDDFPGVAPIHARSVWDAQTSISAKMQGMTYSEFMRHRLCPVVDLDSPIQTPKSPKQISKPTSNDDVLPF